MKPGGLKTITKPHLRLVTPTTEKRTVPPGRKKNSDLRTREHLTGDEVEKLMKAAKGKRNHYGQRNATMILIAYRHGLRAAEVCGLQWDQVDFKTGTLHVRRVKNGTPSTHPIRGDEMRALRELKRENTDTQYVFVSERGAQFTTAGFAKLIQRAAAKAKLAIKAHPHMLRHACGYALARAEHDTRTIQDWLGHVNIQHTVRYTALSPTKFKNFWR